MKINQEKDYTQAEIKELCKKYNRTTKEFGNFINGQTVGMKDGHIVYYGCDVYRFFNRMGVID